MLSVPTKSGFVGGGDVVVVDFCSQQHRCALYPHITSTGSSTLSFTCFVSLFFNTHSHS